MSKTTKALAILGVVAGLGVSMLPMSSYAAMEPISWDGTNDAKVEDSVTVKTTIDKTLSIEIAGTNDNEDDNDSTHDHLVLISKGSNTDGKIMNGDYGEGKATLTITTNNIKGYVLNLKGSSVMNGALNTDGSAYAEGQTGKTRNVIPAYTAALTVFDGTDGSGFGYKIENNTSANNVTDNITFTNNSWAAVVDAGENIVTDNGATHKDGDVFDVTFRAAASASQAADTYSSKLTFTASLPTE